MDTIIFEEDNVLDVLNKNESITDYLFYRTCNNKKVFQCVSQPQKY